MRPAQPELTGPLDQVIALDVRDPGGHAKPGGELAQRCGEPSRVEPGIGDDLDTARSNAIPGQPSSCRGNVRA
jgi:hypothetical protein